VDGIRTRLRATYPGIRTCLHSTRASARGFTVQATLPYPSILAWAAEKRYEIREKYTPYGSFFSYLIPLLRKPKFFQRLRFGNRLKPPYIIGARTPRPVSCYALFKWWLLLSQHPGCLCTLTSFYTEPVFRGLSGRSGLFPSRQRSLSPAVSLQSSHVSAFGV